MSENLVGKTLKKHYYIEKKLDSGGFGTIYLAKDTFSAIGGIYVVKHFSPKYDSEAQFKKAMQLFEQESTSLQILGKHSQIPRIYDFFEEDNNFFLVQEWIEGQTLAQELAETNCFDQAQTIKLLTQILKVVKFIHKSGYIHRDIKPSNLIRNRFDKRIFLIDFGAVKEKIEPKNLDKQGEFVRTVGILSPGYTPDEQFHGKPEFCSDLYALGMVMIQAMTGKHPNSLQRNANLKLIWRDFLPSNFNYDLDFLDLIDRMVHQNWQLRYQSADDILEVLSLVILKKTTNIEQPEIVKKPNLSPPTIQDISSSSNKSNKFKKFTRLGILSAIAIAVCLYISSLQTEKYLTYENKYIKIDYPVGWLRESNSSFFDTSVVFIVFTSPKENESDKFQERVAIIVEESSQPLSLKQYSQQAVSQIENLSNFILSPPKPIILGHSDGKSVIYQGMDQNQKVMRQEVWTVNYQLIYRIIYTAEPEKFSKFLPQAEKMIESLEINKSVQLMSEKKGL
jgi:eukaryotic-like serine/threonine-protein kinase